MNKSIEETTGEKRLKLKLPSSTAVKQFRVVKCRELTVN